MVTDGEGADGSGGDAADGSGRMPTVAVTVSQTPPTITINGQSYPISSIQSIDGCSSGLTSGLSDHQSQQYTEQSAVVALITLAARLLTEAGSIGHSA